MSAAAALAPAAVRHLAALGALVCTGAALIVIWPVAAAVCLATGIALLCGAGMLASTGTTAGRGPVATGGWRVPAARAAGAIDLVVLAIWELESSLYRRRWLQAMAADVHAAVARDRASGLALDPGRGFADPGFARGVRLTKAAFATIGRVEQLSFVSDYEPLDPEVRGSYLDSAPNRTAHALLLREPGAARPAVVYVHGYGHGTPSVDFEAYRARGISIGDLRRSLAIDVAMFVLPLHGLRAAGSRSGGGFLNGHHLTTRAAIAQAVWDLRRLIRWLRAEGSPRVAVVGLSLGGLVAALCAALEPGLDAVVAAVPLVDPAGTAWSASSRRRRRESTAAGLDVDLLRETWHHCSPLAHRPLVPAEGRLILAAQQDQIIPPDQPLELWEHWGRPAIHWSVGTHIVPFNRRATTAAVIEHLRGRLFDSTSTPSGLRAKPGL